MLTVGVTWGFRGREGLIEAGAPCIVSSPEEIMKLIKDKEGSGNE